MGRGKLQLSLEHVRHDDEVIAVGGDGGGGGGGGDDDGDGGSDDNKCVGDGDESAGYEQT